MGKNALGQPDCRIFKSTVSLEQMKKPDFLHVDTDSWKLKIIWKILWWAWSKMGVATLVSGLIFCMLIQIQESCFNNFGFAWSKLGEPYRPWYSRCIQLTI